MIVGVEISSDFLRAVCFHHFGPQREPDRVLEVPLDQPVSCVRPGDDSLVEPVRRLAQELNLNKASVAVAIPSAWCSYRVVSFPYRSPSRVENTLPYALEERLPGPVESHVIEPVTRIIPAGADGARVMVAACPSERVENVRRAFRSAGIEPCIVQPAAVAIPRHPKLAASVSDGEAALVVRVGSTDCEIEWVRDGEVLACQVVRLATPDSAGAQSADAIAEKVWTAIRTYEVSDGTAEFKRVLFLSSGIPADAVAQALNARLDATVDTPRGDSVNGAWAAAWGVAAEAATRRHLAPNLRRGQHAYRPYARRPENRAAAALALAIGIVCVLGIYTVRATIQTRQRLRDVVAEQSALYGELGGVGKPSLHVMQATLEAAEKEAREAQRNQVTSCVGPWGELMTLAPEAPLLRFDKMDINQRRVSIKAIARDGPVASEFQRRLGASDMFSPDPLSTQRTQKGGEVSIETDLEYR